MSKKAQTLRALIRRRLSAAAEEIFELIWEHKEELCPRRRLVEAFFSPEVRLHRADVQLRSAAPTGQELWREEEEEEEEEEEITEFTSAPEKIKDDDDDDDDEEEKSQSPRPDQSSQTEQSGHGERQTTGTEEEEEDRGGPEPAGTSDPDPDTPSQPAPLDSEADTEDCSRVCEEPRSALNPHDGEEPEALEPSERSDMAASSSDDGSDVERNFALLTERQGGGGGAEEEQEEEEEAEHRGEEEEEEENSDDDEEEEDEEGSDAGEEESDSGKEEEVEEDRDGESSEEEEEEEEEDEEDPEVAGGSGEIQTREDIKRELSNMSFEDVMKLRNKVGTKVYDEVAYGNNKPEDGEERKKKKKKRLNKNRPMEISAKRPAPFLRQVVAVKKPAVRDPRFDDLSGEYRPEIFEKTYKFIDDIKRREKEVVQKQLRKTKTSGPRKEKLQFLLKRMENQERASKSREQQRERELQFKRQQRERANQGARPFFLKSSEKKKLQLAEKYEELKRSGKLQNFLSKKRKRNAGKDRRKLPNQPQGQRGRQNT